MFTSINKKPRDNVQFCGRMALYFQSTIQAFGVHFKAEDAAKKLREAMKGLGTDEDAIIDVLTEHCNSERQEIKKMYKTMYGRDLVDDLKSELSGNFEKLCLYLLMPVRLFDAWCLHNAIEGFGTNEKRIIEIICSRNNEEIREIKEQYKHHFKRELEDDVSGDTSGYFRRVLIGLLQANRSDEGLIDRDVVKEDAQALLKAGADKIGTDESVFNSLLIRRSRLHLLEVFQAYKEFDQQEIEGAITSETSGDYQKALLAIVQHIRDPPTYFATCLYESMKGAGTDDKRLMQLIVSRSEIDLGDIAAIYLKKYGKTLSKAISGDTSGDYRKLLLRIVDPSS